MKYLDGSSCNYQIFSKISRVADMGLLFCPIFQEIPLKDVLNQQNADFVTNPFHETRRSFSICLACSTPVETR